MIDNTCSFCGDIHSYTVIYRNLGRICSDCVPGVSKSISEFFETSEVVITDGESTSDED